MKEIDSCFSNHVCQCVCARMQAHSVFLVQKSQNNFGSQAPPSIFLNQVLLFFFGLHTLSSCSENSRIPLFPPSGNNSQYTTGSYMGSGESNVGPHASITNTFTL